MADRPSDRVSRPLHQLLDLGAVGMMSDAQLLDRFVSQRDEAAEAAFEAMVTRHGPMVLRVCRSVLHNAHDAEDVFQAVFLVLANRAGSICRSGSVASWLFGVAHRVATRVKRGAARRQMLNQLVAERTSESDLRAANDPDWEILHELEWYASFRAKSPCFQGLPDGELGFWTLIEPMERPGDRRNSGFFAFSSFGPLRKVRQSS